MDINQSEQYLLNTFLDLFGIDSKYKPIINLLEVLEPFVSLVPKTDIPSLESLIEWNKISDIKVDLKKLGAVKQSMAQRRGNPAAGLLRKSPLAYALLTNVSAETKPYYQGLMLVLLVYLNVNKKDNVTTRKSLCDSIRFSADDINYEHKILIQLPPFNEESYTNYYAELCRAINNLYQKQTDLSAKQKAYVDHLRRLVDIPKSVTPQEKTYLDRVIRLPERTKNKTITGTISTRFELDSTSKNEAPIAKTSYEESIASSAEADNEEAFYFSLKQARYFLERNESLSEINSSRLNRVEKEVLAEFIKNACDSSNFKTSLPKVLIGLTYCTGLDIKRVMNAKFGTTGFIYRLEQLIRAAPPEPKVYKDKTWPEKIMLTLPSCFNQWLNSHSQKLQHADNFLQASKISEEDLLNSVKSELERLRKNGCYRLKLQKIQSSLASELTVTFRNPLYTSILAGDYKTEQPVLMYYLAVTEEQLISVYEKTTNALLLETQQDLFFGTELSAPTIPIHVLSFIKNISRATVTDIKFYPTDIVKAHNSLTHYTVAMLSFGLGHRPVIDPHCYFNDFSSELISSLLSDKVIDERHRYRCQPIPQVAIQQMKAYLWHLKRLASYLSRQKSERATQLSVSIMSMLNGERQNLPLFFIIYGLDKPTESITPKRMEEYWQKHGNIPINSGRSVMATELLKSGVPSPVVEIFLGHFHGVTHPWGNSSERIPYDDINLISKNLDNLLTKLGWKVVAPKVPNRDRVKFKKVSKLTTIIAIHKSPVLGPEQSENRRKKRRDKVKYLVRSVINNNSIEGELKISEQTLKTVRDDLIEQSRTKKISEYESLMLLNRYLSRKVNQGVAVEGFKKIRQIHLEKPLFDKATFKQLVDLDKLRFYLSNFSSCDSSHAQASLVTVLAELTIRASCFGGLCNHECLKSLPTSVFTELYQINGSVFIEFERFRWYPDPSSLSLIIYLYKIKNKINLDPITSDDILSEIKVILAKSGIKIQKKTSYEKLSLLANACQKMYLPGFIRTAWSGEYPSSNFSLNTYVRLLTNCLIKHDQDDDVESNDDLQVTWLPKLDQQQATQFDAKLVWRDFQTLISNALNEEPSGHQRIATAQRQRLQTEFKDYLDKSYHLPQIAILLAAWVIERCQKGFSKPALKISSIKRYFQELGKPLLYLVGNKELLQFTSEEIDELYIQCLDWGNNVDQVYRIGRLFDFHQFVNLAYGLEQPDWSMLFSLTGENPPSHNIDANLLTVNEYDTALELIQSDNSLPDWLKNRYSLLLILGFRFGLRFGEALRLQWRDVQVSNQHVYIQIHNSIYGEVKSTSGVRQIPLVGTFSDLEKVIFDKVMQQAEIWFKEDPQVALCFIEQPRQLINRDEAARYLNALLKHVSADPSIRFHHLRHTWVTRLIATAHPIPEAISWTNVRSSMIGRLGESNSSLLWGQSNELASKLQAISDAAGHARIQTTLSSYFHLADILGAAYLSLKIVDMPIKVLSKLLNKTEAALYKKQTRSKVDNFLVSVVQSEKTKRLFPCPFSKIQVINKREEWPNHDLRKVDKPLTIESVDRLLSLLAQRKGNIKNISDLVTIQSDTVHQLASHAREVELESGFDFYHAYLTSDSPYVLKPRESTFSGNRVETQRISLLSNRINTDLNTPLIVRGIEAWVHSHINNSASWTFDSQDRLMDFLSCLEIIGLKTIHFTLHVPEMISLDQSSLSGLSVEIDIITVKIKPNRSTRLKRQYLVLKPKFLPKELTTMQTLNRVLFCIAVLGRQV